MARGSYLRRVAGRAVPHRPAMLPPRRVPGALPLATTDDVRSPAPPAPIAPAASAQTPPAREAPAPAPSVMAGRASPPAVSPAAPPRRPVADFVFDAPPRQPAPNRPAVAHVSPRAVDRPGVPPPAAAGPDGAAPTLAAPPPARAQALQPPANPMAATLAAALQWTSSPNRPSSDARPAREPLLPRHRRSSTVRTTRTTKREHPGRCATRGRLRSHAAT